MTATTFSLTDKRSALVTLVRQSLLIDHSKKKELLEQVPTMPEGAVDALGNFLAEEVYHAQDFYRRELPKLDQFVAALKNPAPQAVSVQ